MDSKIRCIFANLPQKKHPKVEKGNSIIVRAVGFRWHLLPIGDNVDFSIKKQTFRF